jgi:hypothetical protein
VEEVEAAAGEVVEQEVEEEEVVVEQEVEEEVVVEVEVEMVVEEGGVVVEVEMVAWEWIRRRCRWWLLLHTHGACPLPLSTSLPPSTSLSTTPDPSTFHTPHSPDEYVCVCACATCLIG